MDSNNLYKLDRTAFKAFTAEEADKEFNDYKNVSLTKRLQIVMYLNSVAYNFPIDNPPKVDRTVFQAIAREK